MEIIKSDEVKTLKKDVRERTAGYMMAAFGFVIGLSWNDAVKSIIETYFPLEEGSALAKLIYALVMTVAFVVVTTYINKWFSKGDNKE